MYNYAASNSRLSLHKTISERNSTPQRSPASALPPGLSVPWTSQTPVLETSAQQTIYALSVLLAQPPALLQELSATQPLPITPPEVPVGLPSDLLRRRPDIHQAEAQIHVATAQIGVATAELFPKFSLTGSLTYQSDVLQNLLAGANRSWSFGPAVSWPIFQGGSIRSNIRVQEALRDQAFITYQKTVLI